MSLVVKELAEFFFSVPLILFQLQSDVMEGMEMTLMWTTVKNSKDAFLNPEINNRINKDREG